MKYNIIFILKFRKRALKYYQSNKLYRLTFNKKIKICEITRDKFDAESILLIEYMYKMCKPGKIYILKSVETLNINVAFKIYETKKDMINAICSIDAKIGEEYTNKNVMSCTIFVCAYKNKHIAFTTFIDSKFTKFDKNNDIHLDFFKHYYSNLNISYSNLLFSDDIVKYIKLGDGFKLTKYNPFLINL